MIDPGVWSGSRLAEYAGLEIPLWSAIRSGIHLLEVFVPPDGPNLIRTCMFSLMYPHTEEPACHYHAGKHWLSLDYANGKAHTNIKC